jgi:hypothetical protein
MLPSESLPNLASLSIYSPRSNFFEPWIRSNGFTHDPNTPPTAEFGRLAEHMRWQRGSKGYLRRHREFLEWNKGNNLLPLPPRASENKHGSDHSLAAGHRDLFDDFRSSGFVPDPNAPLAIEFKRLAKHQGWGNRSKQFYEQRASCFVRAFEIHYGNKSERLEGWQWLCGEVHIDPIPESITQCKKVSECRHCCQHIFRLRKKSN